MRISTLKHILATAIATTLAAASCLAFATTVPFPGSTVYLSPLATIDNPDPAPTNRVIRLPPEAGIVTRVITTNLLDVGPSWIVKGDKFWSLCAPRQTQIACSPIAPVPTMEGIHIRAYVGADNYPTVAYDVLPTTTRSATELIASTNYFQTRLRSRVAHFNRYNMVTPPPKKGTYSSQSTTSPPLIGAIITIASGAACSYDDTITIECLAGNGGTEGGGTGIDANLYDWTPDANWDNAAAADPPPSSGIPAFPDGPDPGSPDPCTGPDGNSICQQVVVMANRPQGCIYSLFGSVCTWKPPTIVVDPPVIPDSQPWFSQSTCDSIHVLCTKGQVPVDNERIPSANPGDYDSDVQACADNQKVEESMCFAYYKMNKDAGTLDTCLARAMSRYAACLTTARNRAFGT